VHLGDLFKDDRYRVIRKLGAGSYSTVWLSVDQQQVMFSGPKRSGTES
jgi:serine/threonine protein kinase